MPDEVAAGRDAALLLDMRLAALEALAFVAGLDGAMFAGSRLHQNAVIRSLEVVGEAAGRVSSSFRARHPQIPWRDITGMRNRLIHGYGDVRIEMVWMAARDKLPELIAALQPLIPPEA